MTARQELENRMKELESKKAQNALLEKQAIEKDDLVLKYAERMDIARESLEFLEWLANSRRSNMKGKIESIITEALQMVYGPDRSIEMVYSVKNNRSHLDFVLSKKTKSGTVKRVLDGTGSGLGVSDVVSVPLRLLVLLNSKKADRVCVLDECYKQIGNTNVLKVTQFLKILGERLGFQVILFSHHDQIQPQADIAYQIREVNNMSVVEKV